jgi:15-cis-phytoene synthase
MSDHFDHCEGLVREGDKDRFLSALFAPLKHRRALHALYAFNLEIARTRDVAREPLPGELRLQWWREAIGGERLAEAQAHPVAAALRDVAVRYRLPPQTLVDLVDARGFDLYDEPMATLQDLELYAIRTAAAPIELAARILCDGRDPGLGELSKHLGIAYAVAGLLRALPAHAARRQLYVPAETMARYGARSQELFAGQATAELRAALAELRLRARQHLDLAKPLLGGVPDVVVPALLPVAPVRAVLGRMERRGYRPLAPKEMPQWRRQWVLWRAARSGLRKFL